MKTPTAKVWNEVVHSISVDMRLATVLLHHSSQDPRAVKLLSGAFFELSHMIRVGAPSSAVGSAMRPVIDTLQSVVTRDDFTERLAETASELKWFGALRQDPKLGQRFRSMAVELERNLDRRAKSPSPIRRLTALQLDDTDLARCDRESWPDLVNTLNEVSSMLVEDRPDRAVIVKAQETVGVQQFDSPARSELAAALDEASEFLSDNWVGAGRREQTWQQLRQNVLSAITVLSHEQRPLTSNSDQGLV